jgi:hypothetical protein
MAAAFVLACSSDDSDDGGVSGNGGGGSGGSGGSGMPMPPAVSFTEDIHPILQAKCGASTCHDGEQAPILPGHGAADVQEAYEATQATSFTGEPVYERILERVTDETAMMPPDFASPPCMGEIGTPGCLTQAEVDLIEAWIEAGAPL